MPVCLFAVQSTLSFWCIQYLACLLQLADSVAKFHDSVCTLFLLDNTFLHMRQYHFVRKAMYAVWPRMSDESHLTTIQVMKLHADGVFLHPTVCLHSAALNFLDIIQHAIYLKPHIVCNHLLHVKEGMSPTEIACNHCHGVSNRITNCCTGIRQPKVHMLKHKKAQKI